MVLGFKTPSSVIIHGFSQGVILGFLTALFPCLAIALSILNYGNRILNYQ